MRKAASVTTSRLQEQVLKRMQVQVRSIHLKGWLAIFVALAVFFAVAIGLAILAFGIFLFLVPVMVVASILYYLLPKSKRPPNQTERPGRPEIIDGTYRVLDEPEEGREPPRGDS